MSRIGKLPITVPSGVTITVDKDQIKVEGPKGVLSQFMMPGIALLQQDSQIIVSRKDETKEQKSKHGLMRSLVNNMIIGVT
ncbi:MAG: 50S ribosomal protein L6, partial [Candidatus Saccharibacteria bacterium]